jgi:NADH oxidase (H2O2-forming)
MTKIVVIGLGAAGFGAALAAKKNDRKAEITIIDEKDFDLMHQCGLPFFLEGKIKTIDDLKDKINIGVDIILNAPVTSVDTKGKKIVYSKDGKKEEIDYDKLIITPGTKPFTPLIKTDNKIYTVHNIDDTIEVYKDIKKGNKAIIIGAGAVGLEVAIALNKKAMDITIMDMAKSTFPKSLDKDMSEIVEEKLKEKGIKLELGKKIEEIKEKAMVIMATGVKPKVDFLKDIKIGKFGIEVNEKQETSIKDVYAAGDSVCVNSYINNEKWPSALANNAYREGSIAGVNAAGGNKKYPGILGTFVSLIDDIEIAAVGFNSYFAELYDIKTITSKVKGKNGPSWYGPAKDLAIKLIADEKGKLIGGQAIGNGAKERINILSTAIKAGMTLKDISELELAYCPAVSDYYDVLVMAAELGLRKLK